MARRRRKRQPVEQTIVECHIESLSPEGRGITHVDGKVVFVTGALPDEKVSFQYRQHHKDYDEAEVQVIHKTSANRVKAKCEHFSVCGGCAISHLNATQQIQYKQHAFIQQLKKIGKVQPEHLLPALTSQPYGYRRKARLGVRFVNKKDKTLVGFREKFMPYITEIKNCPVLHHKISYLLPDLGALITHLSCKDRIPQIEISISDVDSTLTFRHLHALTENDKTQLQYFAKRHQFVIYLQPKGNESIHPLQKPANLSYHLPAYAITLHYEPADFTQVNSEINRRMIDKAIALLNPTYSDKVLDLFCGIGNFTLPLATRSAFVTGIEGSISAVQRAHDNARKNNINNVNFLMANLSALEATPTWMQTHNKCLLDPPRAGALEVLKVLPMAIKKIVYISCNPATFARDADYLVNHCHFKLQTLGVMDMFPQTAHVESIALFTR